MPSNRGRKSLLLEGQALELFRAHRTRVNALNRQMRLLQAEAVTNHQRFAQDLSDLIGYVLPPDDSWGIDTTKRRDYGVVYLQSLRPLQQREPIPERQVPADQPEQDNEDEDETPFVAGGRIVN